MGHPAIEKFRHDHDTVLEQCALIESQLRTKQAKAALEKLAADVLDFESDVLGPHLEKEQHSLLAVIGKSQGPDSALLGQAEQRLRDVQNEFIGLRRAIEGGGDLRKAITRIAECLREYAAYEQKKVLRWAEKNLSPHLLDEVDNRLAAMERPVALTERGPAEGAPRRASRPSRPRRK